MRGQQNRKQQRHRQRAEIIQGQHLRHQILKGELLLENPHHQRNFQADQNADQQHQRIQRQPKRAAPGEDQKQRRRGKAAQDAHRQFDLNEARDQAAHHVARQPGADPHREQIAADDGGKLGDGITQQIGGERAGNQFVDQAARGDGENRKEEGVGH